MTTFGQRQEYLFNILYLYFDLIKWINKFIKYFQKELINSIKMTIQEK